MRVCVCAVHGGAPVLASLVSLFLQTLHHIRDLFGLKHVCMLFLSASAAIVCQKNAKHPDLCEAV